MKSLHFLLGDNGREDEHVVTQGHGAGNQLRTVMDINFDLI